MQSLYSLTMGLSFPTSMDSPCLALLVFERLNCLAFMLGNPSSPTLNLE